MKIEDIQKVVCSYYGVRLAELLGRKRYFKVAFPRMVGYYVARKATDHTLEEIGEAFDRHYTAIIHGCKAIDGMLDIYPDLVESVDYLLTKVGDEEVWDYIPKPYTPYNN